jgi:hypothetical protein
MTDRLQNLERAYRASRSDVVRYRLGELIRDLGYIDYNDFRRSTADSEHIDAVEQALGLRSGSPAHAYERRAFG